MLRLLLHGVICFWHCRTGSPLAIASVCHHMLVKLFRTACSYPPLCDSQLFMYGILTSGGEWFLGVSKEDAPAAASACLVASGVYGLYLVFCGLKLMKPPVDNSKKLHDEEDV